MDYDSRRRPGYGPDYRGRNGHGHGIGNGYRNRGYGGYGNARRAPYGGYKRAAPVPVNKYPKKFGGFSLSSFGIGEAQNGFSLGTPKGLGFGNTGGYGGKLSLDGYSGFGLSDFGLNLNQYSGLGKW